MKLNLPKNPLVDPIAVANTLIVENYNLVKPRDVLTDEVMDIFSDLKLKPSFVTLFGANNKKSSPPYRMIHTDLQQQADQSWKKLLFGINWEIGDAENLFSWYDMSKLKEVYPSSMIPKKFKILGGIHYENRFQLGVPDSAVKLDETLMTFDTGPTLVRTDVPHMTVYRSKLLPRVGVSVRFDESDFDTWEDVTAFMQQIKN
jgi:hypothetical protein